MEQQVQELTAQLEESQALLTVYKKKAETLEQEAHESQLAMCAHQRKFRDAVTQLQAQLKQHQEQLKQQQEQSVEQQAQTTALRKSYAKSNQRVIAETMRAMYAHVQHQDCQRKAEDQAKRIAMLEKKLREALFQALEGLPTPDGMPTLAELRAIEDDDLPVLVPDYTSE